MLMPRLFFFSRLLRRYTAIDVDDFDAAYFFAMRFSRRHAVSLFRCHIAFPSSSAYFPSFALRHAIFCRRLLPRHAYDTAFR